MNAETLIGLVGLVVVLIVIYSVIFIGIITPNEGEHTGIVTAADKDVIPFLGTNKVVYFKTSEYATQEDKYCVEDEALFEELQVLARNRTLITITYKNDWFVPRGICSSGVGIIRGIIE